MSVPIGQMLRKGHRAEALTRGETISVQVVRQAKPGLYVVQTPEGEQYAEVVPVLVLKGKVEPTKPLLKAVK